MPVIDDQPKLDFKDVLIRPKRSFLSSRSEVSLERTFTFKHSKQTLTCVPVIAANMDTIGTFEMALELGGRKMITCVHKHYSVGEWTHFAKSHPSVLPYVAASVGISENDMKKLADILRACPAVKMICIDVANGYSQKFVDFIRSTRAKYPHHTILAGNVVTMDMTEELIMSGADIVKVGIGPGSVCTTRKQAGVGYPQLSAVLECADAAHGLSGRVISDGGCTCPGDIAKAFGAGADFVMLGGLLAGHDESGGDLVEEIVNHSSAAPVQRLISTGSKSQPGAQGANGRSSSPGRGDGSKHSIQSKSGGPLSPMNSANSDGFKGLGANNHQQQHATSKFYKIFYGMSSDTAMRKHSGGVADYRSSEGKTVKVPYRGPIAGTLNDICGGVRSTCTYVGAKELKELSKRTTFVRCTQQLNPVFGESQGVDTKTPKEVTGGEGGAKRQKVG